MAAGKAAAIVAEDARIPHAGPRRRLPPAGGVSVFTAPLTTSFRPSARLKSRAIARVTQRVDETERWLIFRVCVEFLPFFAR
jgi:hypothetical protein